LGPHHPLSPVITLGIRHPRKKEKKKERKKAQHDFSILEWYLHILFDNNVPLALIFVLVWRL